MYSLLLLTFGLSLASFTPPNPAVEEVLQEFIKVEQLERIFEKDEQGTFKPLTIAVNNHFPADLKLQYAGKAVKILSGAENSPLDNTTAVLNITDFKMKKDKKAQLKFTYKDVKVSMRMRKMNGTWTYRSMFMKGDNINYRNFDYEF